MGSEGGKGIEKSGGMLFSLPQKDYIQIFEMAIIYTSSLSPDPLHHSYFACRIHNYNYNYIAVKCNDIHVTSLKDTLYSSGIVISQKRFALKKKRGGGGGGQSNQSHRGYC